MNSTQRLFITLAVVAVIVGAIVVTLVTLGLRAPAPGEKLPCGHLAHTVFELGGVKKAVCVKGHAWTRIQGRWLNAADPLAPPSESTR